MPESDGIHGHINELDDFLYKHFDLINQLRVSLIPFSTERESGNFGIRKDFVSTLVTVGRNYKHVTDPNDSCKTYLGIKTLFQYF